MMQLFDGILFSLAYVVVGFIILILAKIILDLITPYNIDEHLTGKDNPALGLSVTGYFMGVIIIFLGACAGDEDIWEHLENKAIISALLYDFLYALGGIVALNIGRVVVDKAILRKFSTKKEILEDRNTGTGAVEFGCYIATGLIVAGSINGLGGGWLSALVFFGLGQIALILFALFYQFITKYDIHKEIERDNVAAGVAMGAGMIAIGVILFRATAGDFISWTENLTQFSFFAVIGFLLLVVMRKVTDHVILVKTSLEKEIAVDQNLAAAWLEGVVNIGMATIIFFMI
ncbi:DUF350 domain-containing protein [Planctomycetota bacterium]